VHVPERIRVPEDRSEQWIGLPATRGWLSIESSVLF